MPTKQSSKLLQEAWDLDQDALLKAKNKKEAKFLWQRSIRICKKLLKDFPREINLLTKIATIYQHQGKFDEVRKYLYRARKYHSNHFAIDHALGNLYRAKGKTQLAMKYYEIAIKHSRGNKLMKRSLEQYKRALEQEKN